MPAPRVVGAAMGVVAAGEGRERGVEGAGVAPARSQGFGGDGVGRTDCMQVREREGVGWRWRWGVTGGRRESSARERMQVAKVVDDR